MQVRGISGDVKVFTRCGNDWTKRFKKIVNDAWHISAAAAIIDGEVVVSAANGATDFAVLQNELRGSSKKIVPSSEVRNAQTSPWHASSQ